MKKNGKRARVGGWLKEPSDHDNAGLILGEEDREERKVDWISAVLRRFGKAISESSSQRRK